EQRRNQQNRVRSIAPRFRQLVGVDYEILAQQRHTDRVANLLEILKTTLEKPLFREHRNRACAVTGILFGDRYRIAIVPNEPLGRRGSLDFGDDSARA